MVSDDPLPDLDDSYFDIYSTKTITNTYYSLLEKLTSGNNASGNKTVGNERDKEENRPSTSKGATGNGGNSNDPCDSDDTDKGCIIIDDPCTSKNTGGSSIHLEDSNGSAITVNDESSESDDSEESSSSSPVSEDDSDVEVIPGSSNIRTSNTRFTRIMPRRQMGRGRRGRGRGRGAATGRGRGRATQQTSEVEVIEDSPVSKRRKTQTPELVQLSDDEAPEQNLLLDDEFNYEVSVKVLWMSVTVKTFRLRKFQKFTSVFEYFMKEENVPYENVLLKLRDVRITKNDTPDSLDLKVCDFIDGGILSGAKKPEVVTKVTNDKNCLTVKLQDKTKVVHRLTINKDDKFKLLMIKYSEQTEIPLKNLKFYYDGELVNPSDTPDALGMSTDEIIDVKY